MVDSRREARQNGLCWSCAEHRPCASDRQQCKECLALARGNAKRSRDDRRANGVCVDCGKPRSGKFLRCAACGDLRRRTYRKYADARCCTRCGKQADAGGLCVKHWFEVVAKRLRRCSSEADIDASTLARMWARQNGRCALTGQKLVPGLNASVDHILPESRGGLTTEGNLQWTTAAVNSAKWDKTVEEFVELCGQVLRHVAAPERQPRDEMGRGGTYVAVN